MPFSSGSMIKREFLFQEKPIYPARLVSNTCALIASVVSELEASATGVEVRRIRRRALSFMFPHVAGCLGILSRMCQNDL